MTEQPPRTDAEGAQNAGDPKTGPVDLGATPFRKPKLILAGLAGWWLLLMALLPIVEVEPELLLPNLAVLGAMAALHLTALFTLRADHQRGWMLGVLAGGMSMMGCVTLPAAMWLLALLFHPARRDLALGKPPTRD